ncbi:MAG: radical SAM protein [Candidatus Omnitrophica bacterium]|nr:radical SAM protein [Candidatus Omnitrophota bacterium]
MSRFLDRAGIVADLAFQRTPIYAILYVTAHCNFRCKMCFYLDQIESASTHELTLEEMRRISRSFGRLIQLSLTGGEPFLRRDLAEIAEVFARQNRVRYLTIPTNGSLPDRVEGVVSRLLASCPGTCVRIPLSLDGVGADHDAIRRTPGSFERVGETYRRLAALRARSRNLLIDVNTTFSGLNQDGVDRIVEFVDREWEVDNLSVTYARGAIRDPEARHASVQRYRALIARLQQRPRRREVRPWSPLIRAVIGETWDVIGKTLERQAMVIPCRAAANKLVVISEVGEVYPCEILPGEHFGLGNLREAGYNIRRLLQRPRADGIRQYILKTRCHCTFECAMNTNVVYHWPGYLRLIRRAFRERALVGQRASRAPAGAERQPVYAR